MDIGSGRNEDYRRLVNAIRRITFIPRGYERSDIRYFCREVSPHLTELGRHEEISSMDEFSAAVTKIEKGKSAYFTPVDVGGVSNWFSQVWDSYISKVRNRALELEERWRGGPEKEKRDTVIRIVKSILEMEKIEISSYEGRDEVFKRASIVLNDFKSSVPTEQHSRYCLFTEKSLHVCELRNEEEITRVLGDLGGLKGMLMQRYGISEDDLTGKPKRAEIPALPKSEEVDVPFIDTSLDVAFKNAALSAYREGWITIKFEMMELIEKAHQAGLKTVLNKLRVEEQEEQPPPEVPYGQTVDSKYLVSELVRSLNQLYKGDDKLSREDADRLANVLVDAGKIIESRRRRAEEARLARMLSSNT